MTPTEILCLLILIGIIVNIIILLFRKNNTDSEKLQNELLNEIRRIQNESLALLKTELTGEIRGSRSETNSALQIGFKTSGDTLSATLRQSFEIQDKRLSDMNISLNEKQALLQKSLSDRLLQIDERFNTFTSQNSEALDKIRLGVQERLETLQKGNEQQLEKMRTTVDEKLQKTLDERITQSFKLVNERLQEVYSGLGEMKALASGVGDLKKVLSNVKTRGIMGELQLGAILGEMLSKEQYEENVITKPSSRDRVEFAIRLPGSDEGCVYLPIDSKFPAETYAALVDAYEAGDQEQIKAAGAALEARIKSEAKDIREKYISPPSTTDFAIMFLPFEGLYAEVVRRGLIDKLQRDYKVNICGPTTLGALLNSLQMGFRTLAIQKRSSEVWNVLGAVKTEFSTFGGVLAKAQERITQTSQELDKLIGVRTRKINSRLSGITELPVSETSKLLEAAESSDDE